MEDKQFEQLVKIIHDSVAHSDKRFTAIDGRYSAIDERFSAIDECFSAMNERFSTLEEKMNSGFENIYGSLETAEQERLALGLQLDRVEGRVTNLETTVKKVDKRLTDVEAGLERVESTLNNIDARVSGVEKKVAKLRRPQRPSFILLFLLISQLSDINKTILHNI